MRNYAKDGGPGEVRLSCNFYHEPISSYTALILGIQALRSYLRPTYEC